jgi:hypothetical protein
VVIESSRTGGVAAESFPMRRGTRARRASTRSLDQGDGGPGNARIVIVASAVGVLKRVGAFFRPRAPGGAP